MLLSSCGEKGFQRHVILKAVFVLARSPGNNQHSDSVSTARTRRLARDRTRHATDDNAATTSCEQHARLAAHQAAFLRLQRSRRRCHGDQSLKPLSSGSHTLTLARRQPYISNDAYADSFIHSGQWTTKESDGQEEVSACRIQLDT